MKGYARRRSTRLRAPNGVAKGNAIVFHRTPDDLSMTAQQDSFSSTLPYAGRQNDSYRDARVLLHTLGRAKLCEVCFHLVALSRTDLRPNGGNLIGPGSSRSCT